MGSNGEKSQNVKLKVVFQTIESILIVITFSALFPCTMTTLTILEQIFQFCFTARSQWPMLGALILNYSLA